MNRKIFYIVFSLFFVFSFINCQNQTSQIDYNNNTTNTTTSKTAKVSVSINLPARATYISLPDESEITYEVYAYDISANNKQYTGTKPKNGNVFLFELNISDTTNGDQFVFVITGKDENDKPILTSKYTEGTTEDPKIEHIIKSAEECDFSINLQLIKDEGVGNVDLPVHIEDTNINKLVVTIPDYSYDKEYSFDKDGKADVKIENAICGDYSASFNFYYDETPDDDDDDGILLCSLPEHISVRQNLTTTWKSTSESSENILVVSAKTVTQRWNHNEIYIDGGVSDQNNSGTFYDPMTSLSKALKLVNCLNEEYINAGTAKDERLFTINVEGTTEDDSEIVIKPTSTASGTDDGGFTLNICGSPNANAIIGDNTTSITTNGSNISLSLSNISVNDITADSPVTITDCSISNELVINAITTLEKTTITGQTTVNLPENSNGKDFILESTGSTFTGGINSNAPISLTEGTVLKSFVIDNESGKDFVTSKIQKTTIGSNENSGTANDPEYKDRVDLKITNSPVELTYAKNTPNYLNKLTVENSDFTYKTTKTTTISTLYLYGEGSFTNCNNVKLSFITISSSESDLKFNSCTNVSIDSNRTIDITAKNFIINNSKITFSKINKMDIINNFNSENNCEITFFGVGNPDDIDNSYFAATNYNFYDTELDFKIDENDSEDSGYSAISSKSSSGKIIIDGGNSKKDVNFNGLTITGSADIEISNTNCTIKNSELGLNEIVKNLPNITFSNNDSVNITNSNIYSQSTCSFSGNTVTNITNERLDDYVISCATFKAINEQDITIDTPTITATTSFEFEESSNIKFIETAITGTVNINDSNTRFILNGNSSVDKSHLVNISGSAKLYLQDYDEPASGNLIANIYSYNPMNQQPIVEYLSEDTLYDIDTLYWLYSCIDLKTPGKTITSGYDNGVKVGVIGAKKFDNNTTETTGIYMNNQLKDVSFTVSIKNENPICLRYGITGQTPCYATTYEIVNANDEIVNCLSEHNAKGFTIQQLLPDAEPGEYRLTTYSQRKSTSQILKDTFYLTITE